jgi:hypothetical protein
MTELDCNVFWQNKLKENIYKDFPDEKSQKATLEYKEKCGIYDKKVTDCISLNTRINMETAILGSDALIYFESNKKGDPKYLEELKKEFKEKNCTKVIEQYRQKELKGVADKFSYLDKIRIEEESKYVRNQRIFFGALILLGGVVMITMFGKNK